MVTRLYLRGMLDAPAPCPGMLLDPSSQRDGDGQQDNENQRTDQEGLGFGEVQIKERIERELPGPHNTDSYSNGEQDQIILIAALAVPEALWPVNFRNGHEHNPTDKQCSDRSDEANRQQEATDKLTQSSNNRPQASRAKSQMCHHLTGSGQPMAAEEAKEFLDAMSNKDETSNET